MHNSTAQSRGPGAGVKRTPQGRRAKVEFIAASMDDDCLVGIEALAGSSGRSRSAVYADLAAQKIPAPDVRLGAKCVRWRVGTVRAWLRSLSAGGCQTAKDLA